MSKTQGSILRAEKLCKSFALPRRGRLDVLKDLDLDLGPGTLNAIVGASGSGKSTLLHVLGTLDRPTGGRVLFEDRDVFQLGGGELAKFRNASIGFVFQFHHLLPELSALENVYLPGMMSGRPVEELESEAESLLTRVGLKDRLDHRPGQLSGGEQQRAAVARALINRPAVLLADEPTGNLDGANAEALQELFVEIVADYGQATLVATHNEQLADRADAVYRIESGRVSLESR
ncbi:MAG: ABC transporter ATP-binding protein [Candidatus Eisenbacteria bacterium]|uniref:ABC transporter ATP-binding protein n=1 Tax=Eiseniibacteriota bacterium TaxID=2212470 RepID=A0A7Y2H172_UNCEI|nr:ABC transporter ATP-binding protein [Candidatus Eisenbacteria bacterium]